MIRTLLRGLLLLWAGLPLLGQTSSDPNEGLHVTHDTATAAATASWWARGDRTYFLQSSADLQTWTYLPPIVTGTGAPQSVTTPTVGERWFARLRSIDQTAADPAVADFDGDGVGSTVEIAFGTDPLDIDTDHDGLDDGAELRPTIVTPPVPATVSAGTTATFAVGATGPAPLSYQWLRDNTPLADANAATYTTPATTLADNGTHYAVVVTNPAGSTTSAEAQLTVTPPGPVITSFTAAPANITVGQNSILRWSVTGATSVRVDPAPGPLPGTSCPVGPTSTTTYTLTATSADGSTTAAVTVTVAPGPANTVTLREDDGVAVTNHPVQIGRPFLPGEIAAFPEVLVDGVPVPTQADVKQRHPDGSVRHAILSFILPSLPARGTATVSFRNQATGGNDTPLSAAEMLDARFDFDARIDLTNGANPVQSASARQMLQDGRFTYWLRGPIATSIILADHSAIRAYDLGFRRTLLTKLTADLTAAATQLKVGDVAGFAVGDTIEVEGNYGSIEFMTIGAIDAATHTITLSARGVNGSTAIAHSRNNHLASLSWLPAPTAAHKSFRPVFVATFWPALNKVQVRVIGENANTESLQDLRYALDLFKGAAAPQKFYTKPTFTHTAGSRWTKSCWLGDAAPARLSINHNLAFLRAARAVPNYDIAKVVPESELAALATTWAGKAKDIGDAGWWEKAMFATGGRPDVGPYPRWTVMWLYSGDRRMEEIALRQAELCGAWTYHWREGNSAKFLDQAQTVPGIGHVLSPSSRPTLKAGSWTDWNVKAADNVLPTGQCTSSGWSWDMAHQADMASVQYLLTGDHWYLEEMYFLAGMGVTACIGYHTTAYSGRGPTGREGGIFNDGQTRSQAWVLRNRLHTHQIAPDADPERAWLGRLIDDALAIWEGARDIHGTAYDGTPLHTWGKSAYLSYWGKDLNNVARGTPPLQFWTIGNTGSVDAGNMDTTVTYCADTPWMMNFVLFALGRAEELGYPATTLRQYLSGYLVGAVTDSGYNPYLIAAYRIPSIRVSDRDYFQTWAEVLSGYKPASVAQAQASFLGSTGIGDVEHGYPNIALAAASYVRDLPLGETAWTFMAANTLANPLLNKNPKWAIVPR